MRDPRRQPGDWIPRPPLLCLLLVAATPAVVASPPRQSSPPESPIGMEARLEVTLPGPQLEPAAWDPHRPLQLRVAESRPLGDLRRYDLRYVGLETGTYDLSQFLRPADGSSPHPALTPIPVRITGRLLPGNNGLLLQDPPEPRARIGGYRLGVIAALGAWFLGLAWILRPRGDRSPGPGAPEAPPSPPEDPLEILVEALAENRLAPSEAARLERLLLSRWQQRLGIAGGDPSETLGRLHHDPGVGPAIKALEAWLHHPEGSLPPELAARLKATLHGPPHGALPIPPP